MCCGWLGDLLEGGRFAPVLYQIENRVFDRSLRCEIAALGSLPEDLERSSDGPPRQVAVEDARVDVRRLAHGRCVSEVIRHLFHRPRHCLLPGRLGPGGGRNSKGDGGKHSRGPSAEVFGGEVSAGYLSHVVVDVGRADVDPAAVEPEGEKLRPSGAPALQSLGDLEHEGINGHPQPVLATLADVVEDNFLSTYGDVILLNRRESICLILLCIVLGADSKEPPVEQPYGAAEHPFPRETLELQVSLGFVAHERQRTRKVQHVFELLLILTSSPNLVINVLASPSGVGSHSLQMASIVPANPDVTPGWRNAKRPYAREGLGIFDTPAVDAKVGEAPSVASARQAGAGTVHSSKTRHEGSLSHLAHLKPRVFPTSTGGVILRGVRVSVIGAGFSGLAAAEALCSEGIEVEVFEARDRIGGRVFSQELPNGVVVERGAEFVLDDYDVLRMLARRLEVTLASTGMAYGNREPHGAPPTDREELIRASASVAELARTYGRDPNVSVRQLLEAAPISPGARAALEARLSISAAHDAEFLAAHLAAHTSSTFSQTESARISGGNSRLADALAGALPNSVHTGHVVRRVRWGDASITVSGDGFEMSSDAALVTVPSTVLPFIDFDPALPDAKRRANQEVEYGHAAKLFVPLRDVAEPSAVMSVPDRFWCWTARGAGGSLQPVVSCFAGSALALTNLDVANGAGTWVDKLKLLRPDLLLDTSGAIVSTWDDDPWVRGAYSAELAGRPRDQQALVEPAGGLFFAGEHTAGPWFGTMEGALRSGRRAAEQLTRHRNQEHSPGAKARG
jgi:monoamine oxidase